MLSEFCVSPATHLLPSLSSPLFCVSLILRLTLQFVVALNYLRRQGHLSINYPYWKGADPPKKKRLLIPEQ